MEQDTIIKFIELNSNIKVKNIKSIILKDYDDYIGTIGKHYIVEVETIDNENKKCYVNREKFDAFENKNENIIWEE